MQFVKVFLGLSGWFVNSLQITCLSGVHVWPVVMCVSPVQNCCYKTKESKICCVAWHGIVTVLKTVSQRSEACCSGDWWNMKLLCAPVAVCVSLFVCLFVCRLWGPVHWDPLEMLLKLRHIKLKMHQCEWGHKGVLKECQQFVSYWHGWQGNKMGVMSSWHYYVQMRGMCMFCLYNYHQTVGW
jgi:hypothetical protein